MRETAIEAARKGGEVARKYFELASLERQFKDDASIVTVADKEAEAAIVACITAAYPDHGLMGEEGASINPEAEYQWVIDSIDGTANFANGIPIFGVSIALARAGEVILGVVYNPATDSLFVAEKGLGATYNGSPIHVSAQTAKAGLITFGTGAGLSEYRDAKLIESQKYFKARRVLGSTAVELCYIARGGVEGTLIRGLSPWDYAAGALIVTEAGGMVTDHAGNPWQLESRDLIASNGAAHEALQALVGEG